MEQGILMILIDDCVRVNLTCYKGCVNQRFLRKIIMQPSGQNGDANIKNSGLEVFNCL